MSNASSKPHQPRPPRLARQAKHRSRFALAVRVLPPLRSKVIYCIKALRGALAEGNADLIERAARAISGLAANNEETRWQVIDAIEKASAKVGKPPWNYSPQEAEGTAKANIKNHAPEIATVVDALDLADALAAAVRRGRPRGHRQHDLKWDSYAKVIAAAGLGNHRPRSLQVGYERRKRTRKKKGNT